MNSAVPTQPPIRWSTAMLVRQTWGNFNLGVSGQQYLHDTEFYNLNLFTGASPSALVNSAGVPLRRGVVP